MIGPLITQGANGLRKYTVFLTFYQDRLAFNVLSKKNVQLSVHCVCLEFSSLGGVVKKRCVFLKFFVDKTWKVLTFSMKVKTVATWIDRTIKNSITFTILSYQITIRFNF